jgi:superoxide dismutase, Fe-Mn family
MRRQAVRIDLNGELTMATILSAESTQRARNGAQKAIAFHPVQRIDDLSRIVDHDIEILKINLAQLHDGRVEPRSSAWKRLESAWETVRSELADDRASSRLTGDVSPGNGAVVTATVMPTVPSAMRLVKWLTGVLEPTVSTRIRQVVRWSCKRARQLQLRDAALKVWRCASIAALAGAKHVSNGWSALQGAAGRKARSLESPWSSVKCRWPNLNAARSRSTETKTSAGAIESDAAGVCSSAWEEGAQLRLESAMETAKSKLALIEGALRPTLAARSRSQTDELTTNSQDTPFVLQPMPWVLGALSPVISARAMMLHGSYHAQCVESANRLARDHKELAGKNSLEIMRWACENARDTELLAMASEAWNHSFYWQCLTPGKKRPGGELGKALDRKFGDFSNFANKFALAGATHLGSGWLWLTTNSRKQVRILTTSGADCPEAHGHTCLLAVDLWEHAYYLDHQNRRREYLDALIDRRLDWDFAEQRFCLFLQRESEAPRETSFRAGHRKRSRYLKRRKAVTARQ